MQIVIKKVNELKEYENNPRNNKEAVTAVEESIKEFGFKVPIVIDSKNIIICGHTRLKAAKKLKLKEVPCVIAEDLNEEQIKAFRLADNKTSEIATWDDEKLRAEIDSIFNIDLARFGFDLQGINIDTTKETIEDNYDITENSLNKHDIKAGDIWKLGKHRLMCGDCMQSKDIEGLMNNNKADMMFTDPPYGYKYQSNIRTNKFEVLRNDDTILEFIPDIKKFITGFVFICSSWKSVCEWITLFKSHYKLSNMIIWDKGGGGIGDLEHTFSTDYEIILCSNNNSKLTGKRIGSVWHVPKDCVNNYVHATQKPVKLSAIAIENTTNKHDIVIDVFGGSGSTLIACEQLDRVCYMMEIDPKYCSVIIDRWEKLTGQKAVRINGA